MSEPAPNPGRLNIFGYRLVVFDLDGTLYRQGPVRRAMLFDLLREGGQPGRLARLRILQRFRNLREEMAISSPQDFDAPLFAQLQKETGYDEGVLRALVSEWMEQRPLRHLVGARVPGAVALLQKLRSQGITVAVWSDYPVAEKLAALGLHCDHALCANDPDVNALKPNPAGLMCVMSQCGVAPQDTLMVGDRLTHDGAAALAAGVDFLLRSDRAQKPLGLGQFHVRTFSELMNANAAQIA